MIKKREKEKPKRQKRLTRLQVMISADEMTALDNFRFQKRMPTRAAAVREILLRGLTAIGFAQADPDMQSRDFGIIEKRDSRRA